MPSSAAPMPLPLALPSVVSAIYQAESLVLGEDLLTASYRACHLVKALPVEGGGEGICLPKAIESPAAPSRAQHCSWHGPRIAVSYFCPWLPLAWTIMQGGRGGWGEGLSRAVKSSLVLMRPLSHLRCLAVSRRASGHAPGREECFSRVQNWRRG